MEITIENIGMGVFKCIATPESKCCLIKYTPQTFDNIWETVKPWLERSIKTAPPWWTLDDIHLRLMRGDYILWLACLDKKPYGVLLTGLEQYQNAIICGVPWIGGSKMPLWIHDAQIIIEEWAKQAGCTFLTGGGREGWGRVANMKNYGPMLIKEI